MNDALVEKTVPLLLRGGEPVEVRIFQCARKWTDLAETTEHGVRHCDSCNQRVHAISDEAGIKWAIAEARCGCVADQSGHLVIGELRAVYRHLSPNSAGPD